MSGHPSSGQVRHPSLPGRVWQPGAELSDRQQRWPVRASRRPYTGGFLDLREDDVRGPDGDVFTRLVVEHKGAVGTVALDDQEWVLLLAQYRHAVGRRLLELPAGILDVSGEDPQQAAARELAEEGGVTATDWSPLLRMWSSPGMTDEHWHIFVARGLAAVPEDEQTQGRHEEADLELLWVPLDEAVRAVLDGRCGSPMAIAGLLALAAQATPIHSAGARTDEGTW